jgi:hypothetical protein
MRMHPNRTVGKCVVLVLPVGTLTTRYFELCVGKKHGSYLYKYQIHHVQVEGIFAAMENIAEDLYILHLYKVVANVKGLLAVLF